MSAAAGAAGASLIIASNAAKSAKEAKIHICSEFMPKFNETTATVEQKQHYAECVNLVHPAQISDGVTIFIKVLIVCAFVGLLWGAWWGYEKDGAVGLLFGGFLGLIAGFVAPASLFLAGSAIQFLFS